jgi:pimeloyl-ACP methyl ester carboxylesterase
MTDAPLKHLDCGDTSIAYRLRAGDSPTLMFLPGYASDMEGTKALALDAFAAERGLAMLRFDYSGTGASGGEFERGTLERWVGETLHLMDALTDGPVVVVGSSMGGWIGLLAARERPERVAAFVGIAAAPDFTEWGYSAEEKAELLRAGRLEQPNPYAPEPHVTHRGFWESGQERLLLGSTIAVDCPVRLIHGEIDEEVPVDVALRTMRMLRSPDVQLTIVKGGGHRLSEPHEIRAILSTVAGLLEQDQ